MSVLQMLRDCKDSVLKSPRVVAKGMWSNKLNMVSTAKMINAEGLTKLIKEDLFIHSKTQVTAYIQKFQLNYKDHSYTFG
jgi:hypothetical protein